MTDFRPTAEQQAIVDAFRTGAPLVIEAGAGTGKTSTLKLLARARPRARGVYIAYNKAIAQDAQASFPTSVTCKTAHSFAYGAVGRHFRHRLNGPRLPAQRTAQLLGIREPVKLCDLWLAPQQLARLTMDTIGRFCYSDADHIQQRHVPYTTGLDRAGQAELARMLTPIAQRAWEQDITQTAGELRFVHDHYLKMWTLQGPQLPADFVLLDEAQDSNGCVAGLVNGQAAQRIWVGDRSQAIYGWRGAVDAMEHAPGTRLYLSRSFRFGDQVAAEANKWLSVLDAPLRLTGFDQIDSTVGPIEAPDAVLCRTNAGAITQVIAAEHAGRAAALVGGGDDIRRFAEAAEALQAGRGTHHPDLLAFTAWSQVRAYVREADESDLRVLVNLVDTHSPRGLLRIVDGLVDERRADVVVSTAHKAKGREWPRVRIAGDFQEPGEDDDPSREEAMLAYVAVTRAQRALDRDGLAWIDRYVPALRMAEVAAVAPAYVQPVDPAAAPVTDPFPVRDVDPAEVEQEIAAWHAVAEPERRADRLAAGIVDADPVPASVTAQMDPFAVAASGGTEAGRELRRTEQLLDASSLGTPHARQARSETTPAGELTGMEPLCPACDTYGPVTSSGVCAGCAAPPVDLEPERWHDAVVRTVDSIVGAPPIVAAPLPPPVVDVPHCFRCGSHGCICDPYLAAAYSARNDAPAGPRPAREAWARARLVGAHG